MTTRELLQKHTADLIRPTWSQHEAPLRDLVTTVHDPTVSDDTAEQAALTFLGSWGRHPVYRKSARYGLILHAVRHRPEVADQVAAFVALVDRDTPFTVHPFGSIERWYEIYMGVTA